MRTVRGLFTFFNISIAILGFLLHGFVIRWVVVEPRRRRELLLKNVHKYSKLAIRIMRISVLTRGETGGGPQNSLLVCNHMSYLDMIVLASVRPSVFVTSVDMGQVFFLGTLAEIGGALFVERRHRGRLAHDIAQIRGVLEEGFDVTLFPEGTSGNGETVMPFKRSLLTAALESGTPVKPITLKYFEVDGEPFGLKNRDCVCWYGATAFFPHFFKLLGAKSIKAKVVYGFPVAPRDGETKHTLTDELHRTISREYLSLGL